MSSPKTDNVSMLLRMLSIGAAGTVDLWMPPSGSRPRAVVTGPRNKKQKAARSKSKRARKARRANR